MIKADFHIHTFHSRDASSSYEAIIEQCELLGIDCIAIADHGTAEGALELKKMAPFQVIVAEEVLTPFGEIMGMFLERTIKSGSSVADTVKAIREQDGLVCIPHPFDPVRSSALDDKVLQTLAKDHEIDVLEVLNARTVFKRSLLRAEIFAQQHNLARTAGSDAHNPEEIGRVFVEMPPFQDKNDFLAALRQGRLRGERNGLFFHICGLGRKIGRRLGGA